MVLHALQGMRVQVQQATGVAGLLGGRRTPLLLHGAQCRSRRRHERALSSAAVHRFSRLACTAHACGLLLQQRVRAAARGWLSMAGRAAACSIFCMERGCQRPQIAALAACFEARTQLGRASLQRHA